MFRKKKQNLKTRTEFIFSNSDLKGNVLSILSFSFINIYFKKKFLIFT